MQTDDPFCPADIGGADNDYFRRKRRLSEAARRKLVKLVHKQGNLCYWCQECIVVIRTLNPHTIVRMDANTVTWMHGGEERTARIATTEHIKALANGGDNAENNLAAACAECNNKRGTKASRGADWQPWVGFALGKVVGNERY